MSPMLRHILVYGGVLLFVGIAAYVFALQFAEYRSNGLRLQESHPVSNLVVPPSTQESGSSLIQDESVKESVRLASSESTTTNSTRYQLRAYHGAGTDGSGWGGVWLEKIEDRNPGSSRIAQLTTAFTEFTAYAVRNDLYLFGHHEVTRVRYSDLAKQVWVFSDTVIDLIPVDQGVYALGLSDPTCVDYPNSRTHCTSTLYFANADGSQEIVAKDMPGAKKIAGYDPVGKVLLQDGYGDGGCISSVFFWFDIATQSTSTDKALVSCGGGEFPNDISYDEYEAQITKYLENVGSTVPIVKKDSERYSDFSIKENMISGVTVHDSRVWGDKDGGFTVSIMLYE